MKNLMLVLVTALMLGGCCGQTRLVYERIPMVPLPEAPVMAPDDGTVQRWVENYVKAATFGYKLYLGIREHARISIERNVSRGTMTRSEGEAAWLEYKLTGALPPAEELEKRYPKIVPEDPGDKK